MQLKLSDRDLKLFTEVTGIDERWRVVWADEGAPDPSGSAFTFRAQYGLDRDILKKMQRLELDKIRVGWAAGYEDYDVQNVNLLRRQAKCLE